MVSSANLQSLIPNHFSGNCIMAVEWRQWGKDEARFEELSAGSAIGADHGAFLIIY